MNKRRLEIDPDAANHGFALNRSRGDFLLSSNIYPDLISRQSTNTSGNEFYLYDSDEYSLMNQFNKYILGDILLSTSESSDRSAFDGRCETDFTSEKPVSDLISPQSTIPSGNEFYLYDSDECNLMNQFNKYVLCDFLFSTSESSNRSGFDTDNIYSLSRID